MARREKSPRERAARALCEYFDLPENVSREKRPMWTHFLPQADAVLAAALPPEEWEEMKSKGP